MIRIELTNADTPNNIISYAQKLGQSVFTTKISKDTAFKEGLTYYILQPKLVNNDLCVVKIVKIPLDGLFAFKTKNKATRKTAFSSLNYNTKWFTNIEELETLKYGNVDWKGKDNKVLCWKGVASRHFQVDSLVEIPGYMVKDDVTMTYVEGLPVEIQHYTPFGPDIYADGEVLETMPNGGATIYEAGVLKTKYVNGKQESILTTPGDRPPKVLGCAYNDDNLITVVSMSYKDLSNPKSTDLKNEVGGYFNEVYLDGARIGYAQYSRPLANWFFNQSGTEAQCVQDHYVHKVIITKHEAEDKPTTYSAVFSAKPACTGSATEADSIVTTPINEVDSKGIPPLWAYEIPANWGVKDGAKVGGEKITETLKVTEQRTCIEAVDYQGDKEVVATSTYALDETSIYETERYGVVGWLEEFPFDPPGAFNAYLTADRAFGVGDTPLAVEGGCGPFTFTNTGPFTVDPNTGTILSTACVTGSMAGGDITVTDSLGATDTHNIRLNVAGTWVMISSYTPCDVPYFSSCTDHTVPGGCGAFGWNYDLTLGGSTRHGIGFCKYPVCPGQTLHSCGAYIESESDWEYRCA